MIRFLLLGCVLLLSACASQAPLPERTPNLALPLQLHIERQMAEQRQDWLLVIQREGPGIRWSMMDPLGIPVARQKLIDGQWQADGLQCLDGGTERLLGAGDKRQENGGQFNKRREAHGLSLIGV